MDLSDISLYGLVDSHKISKSLKEYIIRNNIQDFQELELALKKIKNASLRVDIEQLINKAYKTLEDIKMGSISPLILEFPLYDNFLYKDILTYTDKGTLASNLIFPLNSYYTFANKIILQDIFLIKYLASKINYLGENALIFHFKGIGNNSIQILKDKINFYEEQVLRVAKEIKDINNFNNNLFFYNQTKKLELVKLETKDLLEYLFANSNSFVFGQISDFSKNSILERYLNNLKNPSRTNQIVTDFIPKFQKYIANYTTLEEIETGLIRTRTIDRFILK